MAAWEPLGPATIEITVGAPGTPVDFAGEFLNVFVVHTYEDIGDSRTMLDGSVRGATRNRLDGVRGDTESDLSAAGLYKLLFDHDQETATVAVTQTASGASWTGQMVLSLPGEVGADEFGAPIVSSVEFLGAGKTTFTPATTTP